VGESRGWVGKSTSMLCALREDQTKVRGRKTNKMEGGSQKRGGSGGGRVVVDRGGGKKKKRISMGPGFGERNRSVFKERLQTPVTKERGKK